MEFVRFWFQLRMAQSLRRLSLLSKSWDDRECSFCNESASRWSFIWSQIVADSVFDLVVLPVQFLHASSLYDDWWLLPRLIFWNWKCTESDFELKQTKLACLQPSWPNWLIEWYRINLRFMCLKCHCWNSMMNICLIHHFFIQIGCVIDTFSLSVSNNWKFLGPFFFFFFLFFFPCFPSIARWFRFWGSLRRWSSRKLG